MRRRIFNKAFKEYSLKQSSKILMPLQNLLQEQIKLHLIKRKDCNIANAEWYFGNRKILTRYFRNESMLWDDSFEGCSPFLSHTLCNKNAATAKNSVNHMLPVINKYYKDLGFTPLPSYKTFGLLSAFEHTDYPNMVVTVYNFNDWPEVSHHIYLSEVAKIKSYNEGHVGNDYMAQNNLISSGINDGFD